MTSILLVLSSVLELPWMLRIFRLSRSVWVLVVSYRVGLIGRNNCCVLWLKSCV